MKALRLFLVLHGWYKPQFSSAFEKSVSEEMLVNVNDTAQYAEVAIWEKLYFLEGIIEDFWEGL